MTDEVSALTTLTLTLAFRRSYGYSKRFDPVDHTTSDWQRQQLVTHVQIDCLSALDTTQVTPPWPRPVTPTQRHTAVPPPSPQEETPPRTCTRTPKQTITRAVSARPDRGVSSLFVEEPRARVGADRVAKERTRPGSDPSEKVYERVVDA
jgi:hypothetical protein